MLDHFQKKGRYWADMNNKAYRTWYLDRMLEWEKLGADSIQRDEPTTCRRTPASAAARFHRQMNTAFRKKSSRTIPLSCNLQISGRTIVSSYSKSFRHFDFGMAEFYKKYMDPAFFSTAEQTARSLKKSIVFTGGDYRMDMKDIRRAVASCYANGLNYLVPWDQFTGVGKPRLFVKPEELADIYGFVRACAPFLDSYEAAVQVLPPAGNERIQITDRLFANRGFTVIMVTNSKDSGFGIGGNGSNGSGGIPRLYLTRGGFFYNELKGVRSDSEPGKTEITAFIHDGRQTISIYTNGKKAGKKTDPAFRAVRSFRGGCLSFPFQGSNKNHAGSLAELLIYKRPLSGDEHAAISGRLTKTYLDTADNESAPDTDGLNITPALHFKAGSLAATVNNETPVSIWKAETGHAARAVRVRLPDRNMSGPPLFREKGLNGRPAVEFDGRDDFMRVELDPRQLWSGPVGLTGTAAAYVRAVPGKHDAPVAVHLVEWSESSPLTVMLKTEHFFGGRPLETALLRPAPYSREAHEEAERKAAEMLKPGRRAGAEQAEAYAALKQIVKPAAAMQEKGTLRLNIPPLNPWGILIVSPKE